MEKVLRRDLCMEVPSSNVASMEFLKLAKGWGRRAEARVYRPDMSHVHDFNLPEYRARTWPTRGRGAARVWSLHHRTKALQLALCLQPAHFDKYKPETFQEMSNKINIDGIMLFEQPFARVSNPLRNP